MSRGLDSSGALALDGLNQAQIQAVLHEQGPLLVLAGAGSGKTRVITHRIAHLIQTRGIHPSRIVAVTFTNKAAAEMRERVEALLGAPPFGAWIGTFHALCVRILRSDGSRIGLDAGFNIYDTDDQLALVKRILKSEAGEEATLKPRAVLSRISRAKNALQSADDLEARAFTTFIDDGSAIFCSSINGSGSCLIRVEGNLLTQWEARAGLVFRF